MTHLEGLATFLRQHPTELADGTYDLASFVWSCVLPDGQGSKEANELTQQLAESLALATVQWLHDNVSEEMVGAGALVKIGDCEFLEYGEAIKVFQAMLQTLIKERCVIITDGTTTITFENCTMVEPVSPDT